MQGNKQDPDQPQREAFFPIETLQERQDRAQGHQPDCRRPSCIETAAQTKGQKNKDQPQNAGQKVADFDQRKGRKLDEVTQPFRLRRCRTRGKQHQTRSEGCDGGEGWREGQNSWFDILRPAHATS